MSLPAGWSQDDINMGASPAGTSDWHEGTLVMTGGGTDTGNGTTDSCSWVHTSFSGNLDIKCRVISINRGVNDNGDTYYSKGGIMIRETAATGSRMNEWGIAQVGSGAGTHGALRKTTDGSCVSNGNHPGNFTVPFWLWVFISRDATHTFFDVWDSPDGVTWTSRGGGDNIPANIDPIEVGFFACAHAAGKTSTVVYDQILMNGTLQWVSGDAEGRVLLLH